MIALSSGARLETRFISTIELKRVQQKIPDPAVPRSYIKSQNRWEENPWDPSYAAAKRKVAIQRAELTATEVIRMGCELKTPVPENQAWLRRIIRYGIAKELVEQSDLTNPEDLRFLYLVTECVRCAEDMEQIIEATVITEDEVVAFMRMMGVQRGGMPIDQAPTRNQIETGIQASVLAIGSKQLVSPIDEYDACVASHLSWVDWRRGVYEKDFMVETIAMNRLTSLVDTHRNDAAQTASQRKNKDSK
jgi:hypothetical protein